LELKDKLKKEENLDEDVIESLTKLFSKNMQIFQKP